jgi:CheY-like chemotaxis protein
MMMNGRDDQKAQTGKRILVVDDEKDIVKVLKIRLQGAGYEVLTAYDGASGVLMAHKQKPDLIVLDIRMPAGDGFTVAERLKQAKNTHFIPIIFLTGSPEKKSEERAMGLGARFFVKKPYDPEELLDAIWRALDNTLDSE